jgi:NADP-dependent 3-hydroxy acid dehydrogenase YdfG
MIQGLAISLLIISIWIFATRLASKKNKRIGERVVIIGASAGIGKQLALLYAKQPKISLIVAARRLDKLELTAQECGSETLYFQTDITKTESIRDLLNFCTAKMGGIDTLLLWYNLI